MVRLKFPVASTLLVALPGVVMWVGHSANSRVFEQLGGLALIILVVVAAIVSLSSERPREALQKNCRLAMGCLLFVSIFFGAGEFVLRILYWEGETFSISGGPIEKRFERDFRYNRYDGPSRGPSITGSKRGDALHVLVQGDSITWGQGVKDEEALYTTKLLSALQERWPATEMAVLAKPGREVDGHLEQLLKWGRATHPDIVVYQWYINDIDIDKSRAPKSRRLLWKSAFFHGYLVRNSYLWFFLDYHLTRLFSPNYSDYVERLKAQFGPEEVGWKEFADLFSAWSEEAKALTPRVLVFLYPLAGKDALVLPEPVENIHRRLHELCASSGLICVEAIDWFQSFGSHRALWASPYDQHPNANTHESIAQALENAILDAWPELFH